MSSPLPSFPAHTPPRIVFEDEELLLVDKPAHWLSHPTRPDGQPSLISWLREQRADSYLTLCNRLDRETSGLTVIAKSPEATSAMNRLIEMRQIEKDYLTIVWGEFYWDYTKITAPLREIGITPENPVRIRQGIFADGYAAETEVWRVCTAPDYSLLLARPRTGRLHQIRAHLAAIGLPVVGDKIYGPDPRCFLEFIETGWTPELAARLLLPRHALHATRLLFNWRGAEREVRCELPEDLTAFARERGLAPPPK